MQVRSYCIQSLHISEQLLHNDPQQVTLRLFHKRRKLIENQGWEHEELLVILELGTVRSTAMLHVTKEFAQRTVRNKPPRCLSRFAFKGTFYATNASRLISNDRNFDGIVNC